MKILRSDCQNDSITNEQIWFRDAEMFCMFCDCKEINGRSWISSFLISATHMPRAMEKIWWRFPHCIHMCQMEMREFFWFFSHDKMVFFCYVTKSKLFSLWNSILPLRIVWNWIQPSLLELVHWIYSVNYPVSCSSTITSKGSSKLWSVV